MKKQNIKLIGVAIAIVVVLCIIVVPHSTWWKSKVNSQWSSVGNAWYAVYLSNNQVYFGHIVSVTDSTITLSDTHFIEVSQEPVLKATSKNFAIEQAPKQTFRLIKRGDEKTLTSDHTLYIDRSAVLYWEKLTADSEVVKLIKAK